MKRLAMILAPITLVCAIALGCNSTRQSRDVTGDLRHSLDQSGLKGVSVSQDRDKGVVTLGGHVPNDSDKAQAESIAKSFAPEQVVANEIAIQPAAADNTQSDVQSSLDDGIENNLQAVLIETKLQKSVNYEVKNGVVKLTCDVNSQQQRAHAAEVAQSVPNVKQVVNELQVKNQKATSSK